MSAVDRRMRRATWVALGAAWLSQSCLVSFDGYELGGDGGAAGSSGGAAASGGSAAGGQGGTANAGSGGTAASGGVAAGGTGASGGVAAGGTGASGGVAAGGTGASGGATGGVSGSSTGGTAGAGGSGPVTECPTNLKGSTMSKLPLSGPEDFFCIDTTEVTNAQYELFAATGTLAGQPAQCSFNTNFAPEAGQGCADLTHYLPGIKPDHPVSCVDWCDAHAYCAWAGKRLCGAVGGGSADFATRANPASSQWHHACTLNGARSYPYGNSFVGSLCNDLVGGSTVPVATGSLLNCRGGWTGEQPIYDMLGNVSEWENSCNGTNCSSRGYFWNASSTTGACAYLEAAPITARDQRRGFRCCWDSPGN